MGGVLAFFFVLPLYFGLIALAVAQYILTAKSLQQIANRRGIPNGWMAWIPMANYWAIGSIVDDYDNRMGIKSNWKKVLLTFAIAVMGVIFILYFFTFIIAIIFSMTVSLNSNMAESSLAIIFFVYVALFVVLMLAMAFSTCLAICIYKIFESTVPEKAIKYMVFYMVVPLAGGICLWKCKDQGYSKPEAIEVTEESGHE